MANWQGFARTNYFTVSDMNGLRQQTECFGAIELEEGELGFSGGDPRNAPAGRLEECLLIVEGADGNAGKYALFVNDVRGGNEAGQDGFRFLRGYRGDDDDDGFDFSPVTHVMPYVAEDEVVVFIDIGHEKLTELAGYAEAYVRRGKSIKGPVTVDLESIYRLAAIRFRVPEGTITVAAS